MLNILKIKRLSKIFTNGAAIAPYSAESEILNFAWKFPAKYLAGVE